MSAPEPSIGIDDINVYASSLVVSAAAIARARAGPSGSASGHAQARLELVSRSLPPPWEDPVTLAVEAARPVVRGIEAQIGLCLVATESGVDDAKPLSSYVHRWLGLSERCRHAEVKHACYGGTLALSFAADWVRAGPGRKALVITTDMARRLFEDDRVAGEVRGDSAEPAEGAGAVAMLVSAEPRVMALGAHRAVAAREIYDVMRPTRTAEVIHARRSLAAYLDLLESAWEDFTRTAGAGVLGELGYLLYHTPLVPLVAQAHRLVTSDADPAGADVGFERLVRPSIGWGQAIGNTYSGSLYVALACLAAGVAVTAPTRLGLYSYGSGSCAEFYDGWLVPGAHEVVGRHGIDARLLARREVDVTTYEAIVRAHEASLSQAHFTPELALPAGHYEAACAGHGQLVLERVAEHYRSYRWS